MRDFFLTGKMQQTRQSAGLRQKVVPVGGLCVLGRSADKSGQEQMVVRSDNMELEWKTDS
jgi:hypothetical protein